MQYGVLKNEAFDAHFECFEKVAKRLLRKCFLHQILRFMIPIWNFLFYNISFFAYIITFLLFLKPNADETAQKKQKNVFSKCAGNTNKYVEKVYIAVVERI